METATKHSAARQEALTGSGLSMPVYAKYGEAAVAGFQAVPDLLLKNQGNLGLTPTDMVVLLNILMHWWYPDQKPFPRPTTIAQRIGVSTRTVQRSIINIEASGLLARETSADGRVFLDPTPMVAKLVELAPRDTDYLIRKGRKNTA